MSQDKPDIHIGVLGGGPAGLYAALLLARRGLRVTVFEQGDRPGGLAAGAVVDGLKVDHGSHRLHPSIDPPILADLVSLLGGELAVRERNGRIRLGDRWLSFPLSPRELLTGLPPSAGVRLATGAIKAMLSPSAEKTFADVVNTGLGRPMGEMFYFPYAKKIWGEDPGRLSGVQARRRISADSPLKLVRKVFSRTGGRQFYYPVGGFGRISETLAEAARDAGAEILLNTAVTGLRRLQSGWAVETEGREASYDLVLSTVPMTVLARMLKPPPEVAAAVASLRSRSMVLVYMSVPTERWTSYDAHYFPGADVAFTRISEPKNYRDSDGDPADHTVLCVEIPCSPTDAVWEMDAADLTSMVRADVLGLGLPDPGTGVEVRRLRHAYPIYQVGAEQGLEVVVEWLSDQESLLTFGRQGLFAHDNTHHAMAMARAAVAAIGDDGAVDRGRWEAARRSFARHVVED